MISLTRRSLFQTFVSNSRVRPPLLSRPYPLQILTQFGPTPSLTGQTVFIISNHLPGYPVTVYRGDAINLGGVVLNMGLYTYTQNPGPSVGGTLVLGVGMKVGEWLMVGSWVTGGVGN